MKAIINGVRYDTDKATAIGEASHGTYPADGNFGAWRATLYVSARNRFYFVAGKGGGMTIFATQHSDRSRSGGERIIPMNRDDALAWAEQNLTVEEVEAGFGDIVEDA